MSLKNELSFYFFKLRQNMRNKQALRTSFILQIVAMFLNNVSFYIIWMMFMHTVGTIHGWGPEQIFGMLSISIFIFGIGHTLFGFVGKLPNLVPTGVFDSLLTKPKSLYFRILNHEFSVSALGDLFQGGLGILFYLLWMRPDPVASIMMLLMLVPAVTMQISFIMICDCVVFWLPQVPSLNRAINELIILPGTQPISLLRGGMRFFYLFVIPALLIGGLPMEVLLSGNLKLFALAWIIAGAWLALSFWVLSVSIQRYESGNSIGL